MNYREIQRIIRLLRKVYTHSAVTRADGRRCASPETRIRRANLRLTKEDFQLLLTYHLIEREGPRHIRITLEGLKALPFFEELLARAENHKWNVNMGALPNA